VERGEDVQSGAGLGACCNNSNANVALDPRAERSHKHMQTSSPRLCGARRRDKQGIILLMINMSPIKTIEMENTSSFPMHSTKYIFMRVFNYKNVCGPIYPVIKNS